MFQKTGSLFFWDILKNPSDGWFRVTFSSNFIWMLLDNVYRAQSPKESSFFTLNKIFHLIKRDIGGSAPPPQPPDLQKKFQQNQNHIMARYVCLLWNCLTLESLLFTEFWYTYNFILSLQSWVPAQLTSQFPCMKSHSLSGEKYRMKRGKKLFWDGIYSQGECSGWSEVLLSKMDILFLSQPPGYPGSVWSQVL